MMLFRSQKGLLRTVLCMSLGWILLEKVFLRCTEHDPVDLKPGTFLRFIQSVFLGFFRVKVRKCHLRYLRCCGGGIFPGPGSDNVPGDFSELREESKSFIKRTRLYIHVPEPWVSQLGNAAFECWYCYLSLVYHRGSIGRSRSGKRYRRERTLSPRSCVITDSMSGDILRDMFYYCLCGSACFSSRKIGGYLFIRFCVWYFRRQISDHDPDAAAILSARILTGIGLEPVAISAKRRRYARTAFQAGLQGTVVHGFFSRHGCGTGNTTVTGFG